MSDARSPKPLLEALEVRHNAKLGFATGIGLAALFYVYRVAELGGPVPATRGSPGLFVMLAVVLATSAGALVTILLTVRTAVGLAREIDE